MHIDFILSWACCWTGLAASVLRDRISPSVVASWKRPCDTAKLQCACRSPSLGTAMAPRLLKKMKSMVQWIWVALLLLFHALQKNWNCLGREWGDGSDPEKCYEEARQQNWHCLVLLTATHNKINFCWARETSWLRKKKVLVPLQACYSHQVSAAITGCNLFGSTGK